MGCNFQYFSFPDFVAAVTAHIPNARQKYTNYYGWYSNKSRGLRRRAAGPVAVNPDQSDAVPLVAPPLHQKEYAKSWAMLLRKVWEVDPLLCPKCGGAMKILAVINDPDVVRKILDHLKLW